MPVGSSALEMPFHDFVILNFCRAVNGNRGSVAGGSGGSCICLFLSSPSPSLEPDLANAHPIVDVTKTQLNGIHTHSSPQHTRSVWHQIFNQVKTLERELFTVKCSNIARTAHLRLIDIDTTLCVCEVTQESDIRRAG